MLLKLCRFLKCFQRVIQGNKEKGCRKGKLKLFRKVNMPRLGGRQDRENEEMDRVMVTSWVLLTTT